MKRIKRRIEKDKKWEPLYPNWVKVNFDASFEEEGCAFSYVVIRDVDRCVLGTWLRRNVWKMHTGQKLQQQTLPLLWGKIGSILNFSLRRDALFVIQVMNGDDYFIN